MSGHVIYYIHVHIFAETPPSVPENTETQYKTSKTAEESDKDSKPAETADKTSKAAETTDEDSKPAEASDKDSTKIAETSDEDSKTDEASDKNSKTDEASDKDSTKIAEASDKDSKTAETTDKTSETTKVAEGTDKHAQIAQDTPIEPANFDKAAASATINPGGVGLAWWMITFLQFAALFFTGAALANKLILGGDASHPWGVLEKILPSAPEERAAAVLTLRQHLDVFVVAMGIMLYLLYSLTPGSLVEEISLMCYVVVCARRCVVVAVVTEEVDASQRDR